MRDKKITEEELEAALAKYGISPRVDKETGEKYWHREDFEPVWKAVLEKKGN